LDASRLFIYARSHPSFTGGESERATLRDTIASVFPEFSVCGASHE
jgi:hypothetical protein